MHRWIIFARSGSKIYHCNARLIFMIWTNAFLALIAIKDFGRSKYVAAWVHVRSFATTFKSSMNVGGCTTSPMFFMRELDCSTSCYPWSTYCVWTSGWSSTALFINSNFSLSRLVSSSHSALNLDSSLGEWYLIPSLWTTAKSNWDNRIYDLAKLLKSSTNVRNHFHLCIQSDWCTNCFLDTVRTTILPALQPSIR